MITTDKLPDIANRYWKYSDTEIITINPPLNYSPLPDEWKAKVGRHLLEPSYVFEVGDVHLYGSNLVGVKDSVILDVGYFGRIDLWERNYPYFEIAMGARQYEARELGTAMSLVSVWSNNYFHWVLDLLPMVEAAVKYHQETRDTVTLIIPKMTPSWVTDSLRALTKYPFLSYMHMDHPHYLVKKLLVPTTRRHNGIPHNSALKFLRSLFDEHKPREHKFYISRSGANNRRVHNEDELRPMLDSLGFTKIKAEDHSFKDQMDIFRVNKLNLIAPHGAGLVNSVWSSNPKVIELVTPEYTNPCCWLISAVQGFEYAHVMCEPRKGENMVVDVDELTALAEAYYGA